MGFTTVIHTGAGYLFYHSIIPDPKTSITLQEIANYIESESDRFDWADWKNLVKYQ